MAFLLLFWEYFKIGLFTIGGGYAMLPLVMQTVERYGWLTETELRNFIGVAESTPGPFAINLATFVGTHVGKNAVIGGTVLGVWGGLLGAVTATFAVVLPSVVVILIVTKLLDKFRTNKYVGYVLKGVRPVVVGLILAAFFSVAVAVVLPKLDLRAVSAEGFSEFDWVSLMVFAAFFAVSRIKIKGKSIHPVLLILSAAAVGIVLFGVFKLQPAKF